MAKHFKEKEKKQKIKKEKTQGSIEKRIERKSEKKIGIVSKIFLMLFIIVFLYSAINLFIWLKSNIELEKNEKEIFSQVQTVDDSTGNEIKIDFEKLVAINQDAKAWINIDNTNINYPIVQTDNNEYYLKRDINKNYSSCGSIFLDCDSSSDFTDKNTVIYGHNITSGLMFADLANIYNGSLGNDVTINIYRKDYRLLTYKVFSTYVYEPESYYLTTQFSNDEAYSTYLSAMMSRSVINFNQTVGVDDTIITLSTCTRDTKNRIVVHAKLVSNTEMPR